MSEQAVEPPKAASQDRRKDSKVLSLSLLAVLLTLFISVLEALIHEHLDAVLVPVIAGFGGTILTMIGSIVAFEFGSSKGSQIKDQMLKSSATSATTGVNP